MISRGVLGARSLHSLNGTLFPVLAISSNCLLYTSDPYGQASAGLPADEEGVLTGEIEFRSALTPYTIWGELWIVIYGGGILALIILFRKKRI